MILVRAGILVLALAASLGGTLAASAWAYAVGRAAGLKADAETALFLGLALAGAEVALGAFIFSGARRKVRELDILASLARHGGGVTAERLARFGPLGERLRSILAELSGASERKSLRIASLTGLLRATLDLVERPLLVAALDGRVVECNRTAREDQRLAGEIPARIEELFPAVDPRSLLMEAERLHAPIEREGCAVFLPVYSVRGELAWFLVDLSRHGVADFIGQFRKRAEKRLEAEAEGARKSRRFLGFLRRKVAVGAGDGKETGGSLEP